MHRKKILLYGGSGMLGTDFYQMYKNEFELVSLSRNDGDITDFENVLQIIAFHEPDIICHFAAYTFVEDAENDGMRENFLTNTWGSGNIARAASAFGIPLIALSTEYVFDGTKKSAYTIDDTPNPINAYGISKYLAELTMRRDYPDVIIVRTSTLYGGGIDNEHIITKIRNKVMNGEVLSAPRERFISPTSTKDLAKALGILVDRIDEYTGETLHLVNDAGMDGVSVYEFINTIIDFLGYQYPVTSIKSEDWKEGAKRPNMSALYNTSNIRLPHWEEALKEFLLQ